SFRERGGPATRLCDCSPVPVAALPGDRAGTVNPRQNANRMKLLTILMLASILTRWAAPIETGADLETIPGTLVQFWMLHVPGGTIVTRAAGGRRAAVKVAPFRLGKTEVTWDEYDIYAFRLDQTEEQKAQGVDAVSRPSKPYGAPDRGFGHH